MPRQVIVLKFGSSVLQSRADLPKAVHEIYRWVRRQYRVVAVVSAFAGETDRLLGAVADYRDATPEAIARVVATGEEVATAFLALELDRFGIPAQILDASQIQLVAEPCSHPPGPPASPGFGLAGVVDTKPVSANILAIENVLQSSRVAVIPGFVARDRRGRVALFGRGGSDLSALFLAKQLGACCRLIKDVDGIYDSDPAKSPAAQRFHQISFADALAIGGKIVQPKAIAFGRNAGIHFEVAALGQNYATTVGAPRSLLTRKNFSHPPVKIGLLGLGTVGLGVFQELSKHPELFEITGIAVRRPELHRDHAPNHLLTRDCWQAIDGVDVVVELIGGTEPAGDLVRAALDSCKPVVTANKLLLAGNSCLEDHRNLRYSAAVGGAVPALEAITALTHSHAHSEPGVPGAPAVGALGWKATSIVSFSGVLNGTCNYLLDRIAAGCSWEQALAEAQANGFAEPDPRADISGADTVCKLRLLARRAFPQVNLHYVSATGIDAIDPDWVQAAARDGGRVRLVGTAQLAAGTVHLDVKPQVVDAEHPFAQIRNEENCLLIETAAPNAQHIWTGRGAGRWPTTAAVMADLFDLSRELRAASCQPQAVADAHWLLAGRKTVAPQLTTDNWPLTTDSGGAA